MLRHTEIAEGVGHWLKVTTICLAAYYVGKHVYEWAKPRITGRVRGG
jgi:hypothetical protein